MKKRSSLDLNFLGKFPQLTPYVIERGNCVLSHEISPGCAFCYSWKLRQLPAQLAENPFTLSIGNLGSIELPNSGLKNPFSGNTLVSLTEDPDGNGFGACLDARMHAHEQTGANYRHVYTGSVMLLRLLPKTCSRTPYTKPMSRMRRTLRHCSWETEILRVAVEVTSGTSSVQQFQVWNMQSRNRWPKLIIISGSTYSPSVLVSSGTRDNHAAYFHAYSEHLMQLEKDFRTQPVYAHYSTSLKCSWLIKAVSK